MTRIRVHKLHSMSDEERARFYESASPNGAREQLDARIRVFEQRFGFSTTEMRHRVSSGELYESRDISEWLILGSQRELT